VGQAFPLAAVAVVAYEHVLTSVRVTPERVVVRDASMPTQSAKRSRIASVHRHSYWIVLRDGHDKRVLRMRPVYTTDQMHDLGGALGVPFVDHVKGHGIKGRLFG
jgi:hypothetical protein